MKVIHTLQFVFLLVCCCCFASLHDPNQPERFPSPALPTRVSRSVANPADLSGTGQEPITSTKTSPAGVGDTRCITAAQSLPSNSYVQLRSRGWEPPVPSKATEKVLTHTCTWENSPQALFTPILPINFEYICMCIYTHTYITLVTY